MQMMFLSLSIIKVVIKVTITSVFFSELLANTLILEVPLLTERLYSVYEKYYITNCFTTSIDLGLFYSSFFLVAPAKPIKPTTPRPRPAA